MWLIDHGVFSAYFLDVRQAGWSSCPLPPLKWACSVALIGAGVQELPAEVVQGAAPFDRQAGGGTGLSAAATQEEPPQYRQQQP